MHWEEPTYWRHTAAACFQEDGRVSKFGQVLLCFYDAGFFIWISKCWSFGMTIFWYCDLIFKYLQYYIQSFFGSVWWSISHTLSSMVGLSPSDTLVVACKVDVSQYKLCLLHSYVANHLRSAYRVENKRHLCIILHNGWSLFLYWKHYYFIRILSQIVSTRFYYLFFVLIMINWCNLFLERYTF